MSVNIEEEEEEFPEIKRISSASIQFQEADNERRWRLSHLKDQFESLELHHLFSRYIQRISHGYFSQFLTLQIILITAHFIILLAAVEEPIEVLPDLILYGLISLFSIILLIITDTYVKEHPKLLNILTVTAFVTTFFMNAFIPFYYRKKEPYGNLRPAYTTYLIISNYIFLNIQNDLTAFMIGVFISVFHIVALILVTYENTTRLYERIGSDSIYLICINSLGMYFRYMNEIVIRRSFLDRRSCIQSTHQLKFEEEQENQLMSSIIPQHIIARARDTLTEYIGEYAKSDTIPKQKPFDDFYVEEHPNVTILFADIVNYTAMTTKTNVIELLDILNELFGRFDDASEKLQVLRIKFLGDCYYCVAGLPPNPVANHADACVDLGLKMISIITDIRQRKDLNINMRIGIHTGSISCGIIGTIKWQYDIWSTDVDIANKMETEGTPGMVHITTETKIRLKKNYNIIPTAKRINNKRTYLIEPDLTSIKLISNGNGVVPSEKSVNGGIEPNIDNNQRRPTIYIKRISNNSSGDYKNNSQNIRSYSLGTRLEESSDFSVENEAKNELALGKRHTFPNSDRRNSGLGTFNRRPNARFSADRRLTNNDRKRRTAFMNNNIKRYKEGLEQTNKELEETIENMRLSKFEQWFKVSDMYRIFIVFKDLKSEMDFLRMPDPLFKYYLLSEVLLLILVFILENLTLSTWSWPTWPFYLTLGLIIFFFLPISWTQYLWTKYIAKSESDLPTNKILKCLCYTSQFITNNALIRFAIYTAVYALFCICVLTEWLDCYQVVSRDVAPDKFTTAPAKRSFLLLLIINAQSADPEDQAYCIIPWHMTETFALAIIMCFLFLRMYMWLKILYAAATALAYAYCILQFGGNFFGDSQTFNYALPPEISHIMSVFFLTITLHLVDRQTEYMNRIDHLWYKNLIEKEKKANEVHIVNNVLLRNVLPIHVADLYLNVHRHSSEEMYHERYVDVAVMFATITNFSVQEMGQGFLKIMSGIISEFDMLLLENSFGRPIEKIKIAKWTYMAACGLAPGLGDGENIRRDPTDHVVISLLKFAACLMQKLKELNENREEMKLRIGISNGPIAAGVVGSKKPLYDIWGDPVNMASRMDTTGLENHIQVLKHTAEIIENFGYVCHYRGEIEVKGPDKPVPTYFVALDENFQLIKRNEKH